MPKESRVVLWLKKVFQNTMSKWVLTDFPSLIRENFENGFLLCRPAVGFACSTQFIDGKIHSSWVNFHFFHSRDKSSIVTDSRKNYTYLFEPFYTF